jgi:hypothetical protein
MFSAGEPGVLLVLSSGYRDLSGPKEGQIAAAAKARLYTQDTAEIRTVSGGVGRPGIHKGAKGLGDSS